jgi:hypothetical protein
MFTQLNPSIPMDTPKGSGLALAVIDYGLEHNLLWVVAIDATGSFSLTGLEPGTTYLVKVRHDYGSGNFSDFTTEISVATAETPPSETAPTINSVTYSTSLQQASVAFTPGTGGSGNYTVERSTSEAGTYTALSPTVASSPKTDDIAQTSSTQVFWYRVKRSAGYSAPVSVSIPAVDPAQSPINILVVQIFDGDPFEISWTDRGATGADVVEISEDGVSWTEVDSDATNPTTHTPPYEDRWRYRVSNSAIPGVYSTSARMQWNA